MGLPRRIRYRGGFTHGRQDADRGGRVRHPFRAEVELQQGRLSSGGGPGRRGRAQDRAQARPGGRHLRHHAAGHERPGHAARAAPLQRRAGPLSDRQEGRGRPHPRPAPRRGGLRGEAFLLGRAAPAREDPPAPPHAARVGGEDRPHRRPRDRPRTPPDHRRRPLREPDAARVRAVEGADRGRRPRHVPRAPHRDALRRAARRASGYPGRRSKRRAPAPQARRRAPPDRHGEQAGLSDQAQRPGRGEDVVSSKSNDALIEAAEESAAVRRFRLEALAAIAKFDKGDTGARITADKDGPEGKFADAINGLLDRNQKLLEDVANINATLAAVKRGNFSVRMPGADRTGSARETAVTLNEIIDLNERLTDEFERISKVVGKDGNITQRAAVGYVSGGWKREVNAINALIADLVQPTNEVARVIGAVAKGDLSQSMALNVDGKPVKGEFLRIAKIVNTMVDQLNSFSSAVTRVAREVGTEGKLGGQAKVKGVAGTWKDLTDNVNSMAANLTAQVRNIADVTTAVAKGDLSRKITVDVKGEILALKDTINTMVDQLRSFSSEVTRVAREV